MNIKNTSYAVLRVIIITLALVCGALDPEAQGAIYYLSPTGSDSNSGTSLTSPWKTFSFAIPRLQPGDTLILRDGTYNTSNSGYLHVFCDTNAKNGTASQPIVIRAENERRAFIKGDGSTSPIFIRACSYWKFHGIRAENADTTTSYSGDVVHVYKSSNLVFQRMLLAHPNLCMNASVMTIWQGTGNSLVEESEFYDYHRHGLNSKYESGNIFRRNYFNSRARADASCSPISDPTTRGDAGLVVYPGSAHVIENNISEGNGAGFDVPADGTTIGNKFLGNISLNDFYGIKLVARGNTLDKMPRDTIIEQNAVISARYAGFYLRASKNTQVKKSTALNTGGSGFIADRPSSAIGDGAPSVFSTDTLVLNSGNYGFYIADQTDWRLEYPNAYNNGTNFSPHNSNNIINPRSVDAGMGNCRVYVPESSQLNVLGSNGSNTGIGAKVLYRYEGGVLTNQPLWDPTSGQFSCGAVVAGVNDVVGSSCFDVHRRLNVNTNGCPLPMGYGGQPVQLTAPTDLQVSNQ